MARMLICKLYMYMVNYLFGENTFNVFINIFDITPDSHLMCESKYKLPCMCSDI